MGLEEFAGEGESGIETGRSRRRNMPLPESSTCDERREKKSESSLVQWTGFGPNTYIACTHTWPILPGGVYYLGQTGDGRPLFHNLPLALDDSYYFADSIGDKIIKEIENFWDSVDRYEEHGYCHRRGYLLYGPVGSGKSVIVQQAIERIVKRGGIVILCNCMASFISRALQEFRLVEPNRPLLCVFEDIDSIIEEKGESDLLALLDGENQVSKVLNLATTNYPERLDRRIVARPRRFDRVIKVGMPDEDVRRAYFQAKTIGKLNGVVDVEKLVAATDGFSFAALAETIISIECLGNDFEETIVTLREMINHLPSSTEYNGKGVGFGSK